jgi:pyruvate dehydrogenase E2 component (dihydrolipoamide acetyltransferase)
VAEIVMPRLSDSMEEGTILQWMKGVGDAVAIGEELVEIETDKANMAYEADVAGTLTEILAKEGDTLPIGEVIAVVGDPEAADDSSAGPVTDASPTVLTIGDRSAPRGAPASAPPPDESVDQSSPPTIGEEVREERVPGGDGERVKASPVAKRIAKDNGVDLSGVEGSGPGGRIIKADVEKAGGSAASASGPAAPASQAADIPPSTRQVEGGISAAPSQAGGGTETAKGQTSYEDLSKLQQVVARRMSESKATAPHFYLEAEIDMSAAVKARRRLKAMAAEGEVVPSFNDMVVKACALALEEHPRANGAYRDGRFELYSRVNVGVAVAAQDALVVPTVFDADKKGLRQIAEDSRIVASKVRDGSITPPELSGGTFTVSNLGMYGIDNFSAVINTPQAAILAVGAIEERAVVRDGELAIADMLGVTLACDHRILYGAPAAEFLARVRALLEEPLSLAL